MNIKKYFNPKAKFIGNYSLNDLKAKDHITLDENLTKEEIVNLEYLKDGISITIKANYLTNEEERRYYRNIKKIIESLTKHRKTYHINIEVNNRELLRQSNLLTAIPKNVKLIISNNDYPYSLDEYLSEETKLENLVKPIRDANLSPLEKYLAAYDVVKSFKPYKENEKDKRQSRDLRYILKDDNKYIVCVGFARLLLELLTRLDIPCKYIHVDVDDSYEKKYGEEIKNINHVGHARNLVKIDDDKYNIHGIYLSDSTFDSAPSHNVYLHSLLTFDRLKEAKNLEKLNDIDLLLDFHSLDDFKKKIAYFIKKEDSTLKENNNSNIDLTKRTYKILYLKIMEILRCINEPLFVELYNKYYNDLCINIYDIDQKRLNEIISHFTTEYYQYIIKVTNKQIDINTILTAAAVAKKQINKLPNEELATWLRKLIDDSFAAQEAMFPYVYDPNNDKEAYLEERKTKK